MKSIEYETVGLIAAAGISKRLSNIGNNTIKEMIDYECNPIICNCIESLFEAQVSCIIIVVRLGKEELVDFIKSRYPNTKIKFVYQSGKIGNLIDAIKAAYDEIKHKEVLFRLGDTYITPNPFVSTYTGNFELTLGCFHSNFDSTHDSYSNYAVIDLEKNIVMDKPNKFVSNVCWGALSWKSGFTEKLMLENDLTEAINKSKFNYKINIIKFVDVGNELVKKYLSEVN